MNASAAPARPAPLPSSSLAGRDELPHVPPAPPVDLDAQPRMAEDEFSLWLSFGLVVLFIVLMAAVAATGGL